MSILKQQVSFLQEMLFTSDEGPKVNVVEKLGATITTPMEASAGRTGGATIGRRYNPIYHFLYDGEKNPGEMGVIKKYRMSYKGLRNRAWQAYLDSDVLQGIVNKYVEWTIGTGLRIQSNPLKEILEESGISLPDDHNKRVEKRFNLFANSKSASYNKEKTLNQLEAKVYKNAIIGGDMLVVLHVVNNRVKVQCIEGEHVISPATQRELVGQQPGTTIKDGVEIDETGTHVAYWVKTKTLKFERIEAFGEGGVRMAYLVYGQEYRYDEVRGIPLVAGILESIKKLERYKEAAVAGAEERAKIAYFFEHTKESTGENPMENMARASLPLNRTVDGGSSVDNDEESTILLANKIVATTGKQTFNLPNETTVKSLDSDMEIGFKDFFETNLLPLCAAVCIPVEIAMQKFSNNFSASRGALKLWEHTIKVTRENFSLQFMKPIFNLWLIMEDVRGDILSPQLFRSLVIDADDTLFEAYTNCSWNGVNVPHVDPVKEVKAVREKLGPAFAHVSLTTVQKAIEELGGGLGDFEEMIEIITRELEQAPDAPEQVAPSNEPSALPEGES